MNNQVQTKKVATQANKTVQYLTFMLDGKEFATQISDVREALIYDHITRIPCTPDYMLGVIQQRDDVIPVIDMRLKFGVNASAPTMTTCIVIAELQINNNPLLLGVLVDSVHDVINLKPDQLEPSPDLGDKINTEYIQGMGSIGSRFIVILDLNKIFSSDQLMEISQTSSASFVIDNASRKYEKQVTSYHE